MYRHDALLRQEYFQTNIEIRIIKKPLIDRQYKICITVKIMIKKGDDCIPFFFFPFVDCKWDKNLP